MNLYHASLEQSKNVGMTQLCCKLGSAVLQPWEQNFTRGQRLHHIHMQNDIAPKARTGGIVFRKF